MPITHHKVTGLLTLFIMDQIQDVDHQLDEVKLTGTVTWAPVFPKGLTQAKATGPNRLVSLKPITSLVADGQITSLSGTVAEIGDVPGGVGQELPVMIDDTPIWWQASFDVAYAGSPIRIPPMLVDATEGDIDLTTLVSAGGFPEVPTDDIEAVIATVRSMSRAAEDAIRRATEAAELVGEVDQAARDAVAQAGQSASEAKASAAQAQEGADRVGTAEQVISARDSAAESAVAASTSASEASGSASAAASSATTAAGHASAAQESRTAAGTSASAAASSETSAADSASKADANQKAAHTYQETAWTARTDALNAKTDAVAAKEEAQQAEANASTSATTATTAATAAAEDAGRAKDEADRAAEQASQGIADATADVLSRASASASAAAGSAHDADTAKLAAEAAASSAAEVVSSGVADATTTVKGKLQLTGDLSGTADAPTVPALSLTAPGAALSLTPTGTGWSNGRGTPATIGNDMSSWIFDGEWLSVPHWVESVSVTVDWCGRSSAVLRGERGDGTVVTLDTVPAGTPESHRHVTTLVDMHTYPRITVGGEWVAEDIDAGCSITMAVRPTSTQTITDVEGLSAALTGKRDLITEKATVYAVDAAGAQDSIGYSTSATAHTLGYRGEGGTLEVGAATSPAHAVTKAQLDTVASTADAALPAGRIQLVDALPTTPTEGVLYLVKE